METSNHTSVGSFAAVYMLIIGLGIGWGLFGYQSTRVEARNADAISTEINFLVFILTALCGIGLYMKQKWARYLFFIVAPLGSLSLAATLPKAFWSEDLPYTIVLIGVFVPLSFLLSRKRALEAFKQPEINWQGRGGRTLLFCTAILVIIRLFFIEKPSTSGYAGAAGLYQSSIGLNRYVSLLAICDTLMWNYIVGFIAVSIPLKQNVQFPLSHINTVDTVNNTEGILNLPVIEEEKLELNEINLGELNNLIQKQKQLFRKNHKDEIQEMIRKLAHNKEEGILLLNSYMSLFKTGLIVDLIDLNNTYEAIKENVSVFIKLNIVNENFPHNSIEPNSFKEVEVPKGSQQKSKANQAKLKEELEQLKIMKEKGFISEEVYKESKNKIIASYD